MFDQDHGLIQPFTAKDNRYAIANLRQNNSNDVFMFSLQSRRESRSQLRRAEHRKLGLTVFNWFFCIEGKTLRVCRSILDLWKYQRGYWPTSEIYFVYCSICSAMRRVFFTVTSSSAQGLSSDEFLMTHSTSRLN